MNSYFNGPMEGHRLLEIGKCGLLAESHRLPAHGEPGFVGGHDRGIWRQGPTFVFEPPVIWKALPEAIPISLAGS